MVPPGGEKDSALSIRFSIARSSRGHRPATAAVPLHAGEQMRCAARQSPALRDPRRRAPDIASTSLRRCRSRSKVGCATVRHPSRDGIADVGYQPVEPPHIIAGNVQQLLALSAGSVTARALQARSAATRAGSSVHGLTSAAKCSPASMRARSAVRSCRTIARASVPISSRRSTAGAGPPPRARAPAGLALPRGPAGAAAWTMVRLPGTGTRAPTPA